MARKTGATLIIEERSRRIQEEGWTTEHDAQWTDGELVQAAIVYAKQGYDWGHTQLPTIWPWHQQWLKPKDRLANLIRAGALIAAEIDRLLASDEYQIATPLNELGDQFTGLASLVYGNMRDDNEGRQPIRVRVSDVNEALTLIKNRRAWFGNMLYGADFTERDVIVLGENGRVGYVPGQMAIVYLRQAVGLGGDGRLLIYLPDTMFRINRDGTIQAAGSESLEFLKKIGEVVDDES